MNHRYLSLQALLALGSLLELPGESADAGIEGHHPRAEVHVLLARVLQRTCSSDQHFRTLL